MDYAFDRLFLERADLRRKPLVERRRQLEKLLLKKPPDNIRFSAELPGGKDELLHVARQYRARSHYAEIKTATGFSLPGKEIPTDVVK